MKFISFENLRKPEYKFVSVHDNANWHVYETVSKINPQVNLRNTCA